MGGLVWMCGDPTRRRWRYGILVEWDLFFSCIWVLGDGPTVKLEEAEGTERYCASATIETLSFTLWSHNQRTKER